MPDAVTRPLLTIAVVDDDPQALRMISTALEGLAVEVLTASQAETGFEIIRSKRPQVVLLDLVMPGVEGMEMLERIVEFDPVAEVILMTGHYSTDSAVEAIRKGAGDYLSKPLDLSRLRERIQRLLDEAQRRRHAREVDAEAIRAFSFEGIVARSALMLDLIAKVRRIAPHFRTVLVSGATGTGKELFARALHKLSPVSHQKMAVSNCAAIVDTLFESELFGYVKGAFTGAAQDKMGLFEYANGGSVFLDEIGELPLAAQAKLLRVLQEQEVQRVGSPIVRKVDVRVIAATNRNLKELVAERKFREDLYYRLAMLEINIPPLAHRAEDLPLLLRHFVERFGKQYGRPIQGLTRRAQTLLARYPWPGNVRELENLLGNACMMAEGNVIDVHDLPASVRERTQVPAESPLITMSEMELVHFKRVLQQVGGNKVRAGEVLDISRGKLYRLLGDLKKREKLSP
jgi:DNA-binding NtrC family response regulator